MSGRWFRFYDEAVNDPKVQRLPAPVFRFWVNTLCLASKNGGNLPSRGDMEFALRLSEAQLSELIVKLITAELLDTDGETLSPHNWNGRQYKSDVSTERVKRFRERQETVSETPPEQRQSRAETEQKETPSLRSGVVAPAKAVARQRKPQDDIEHPSFQEFYEKYPRREGRRTAAAAYRKAVARSSPEEILVGSARYTIAVLGEHRKFVKLPTTWLNGDHWKDEVQPEAHNGQARKPTAHDNFLAAAFSVATGVDGSGRTSESGDDLDGSSSHGYPLLSS